MLHQVQGALLMRRLVNDAEKGRTEKAKKGCSHVACCRCTVYFIRLRTSKLLCKVPNPDLCCCRALYDFTAVSLNLLGTTEAASDDAKQVQHSLFD